MSQTSKKKNVDVINAGVIGYPIHHSKSPLIQNYFINTHNLNAVYKKYEIKDEVELKSFTHRVLNGNWAGFNITIPHKQTIIPFLNTIDEDVKCIGACNTVVIKNNQMHGYNTDAEGFYYPIRNENISSAMILGNGGASRAVLYQLCKEGISDICVVARNHDSSIDFIAELNNLYDKNIQQYSFLDVTQQKELLHNHQLVVNTTSVGMSNDDPPFEFISNLTQKHIFYDLIESQLSII